MLFSPPVLPSRRASTLIFLFNQHEFLTAPEPIATLSSDFFPPRSHHRGYNAKEFIFTAHLYGQEIATPTHRFWGPQKGSQHMQTGNDENIDEYTPTYLHSLILWEEDSSVVNSSQKCAVPVKHQ